MILEEAYNQVPPASVDKVKLHDYDEFMDFVSMLTARATHELSPLNHGCLLTNLDHAITEKADQLVRNAHPQHQLKKCTDVMLVSRLGEAKMLIQMDNQFVYQVVFESD